ncbi:MAG: polysaccharide deacetylase family protein [Niabella sp.]
MYFTKTPWWLKRVYPTYHWDMGRQERAVYLTFDDGPHPEATPFVLEQLARFDAKATFFCIGKNVEAHGDIYARIRAEGHAVGNHTHNHLNGWHTEKQAYVENVEKAAAFISTGLFRPPYGRVKRSQACALQSPTDSRHGFHIIMWDVLSADFDRNITPQTCLNTVLRQVINGSIVVFHDSEKAFNNMKYALPKVLEHFTDKGFAFKPINLAPIEKGPE